MLETEIQDHAMNEVIITGLKRVARPKPNKGGSIVMAFFDCEANGFGLKGCALVRTPKNGLTVWPPKLDGPESARRSVTILNDALRHEMMQRSREAYRALGGMDAEWIPRSAVQDDTQAESAGEATEGLQRFLALGAEARPA